MNIQVLDARRDTGGGYKVDVGRGERVGRVSSEWFSRPADERYLSLSELAHTVRDRTDRSRMRVVAENIERAPLHPLDQFRAFHDMLTKGMTEEEIAAAFFVPVNVVKQRLRLATVSPTLHEIYADNGMTLEQLMAFTVSENHDRQVQVWDAIRDAWSKEPYQIRRMLTETTVRASDKRAVFLGIEAYEAAGGIVMRDLFQADDGGWLQDVGLLDHLIAEKLKAEAEVIAAEGWKWIEVAVSFPYDAVRGLHEVPGAPISLAENPHIAMTALLHKLVSDNFMTRMYTGAMEAGVKHVFFPVQDETLKDSPSARAVQERHDAWAADIPKDDATLRRRAPQQATQRKIWF